MMSARHTRWTYLSLPSAKCRLSFLGSIVREISMDERTRARRLTAAGQSGAGQPFSSLCLHRCPISMAATLERAHYGPMAKWPEAARLNPLCMPFRQIYIHTRRLEGRRDDQFLFNKWSFYQLRLGGGGTS